MPTILARAGSCWSLQALVPEIFIAVRSIARSPATSSATIRAIPASMVFPASHLTREAGRHPRQQLECRRMKPSHEHNKKGWYKIPREPSAAATNCLVPICRLAANIHLDPSCFPPGASDPC